MAANNFNTRNMGLDVSNQPRLSNGQFTFKDSATAATYPPTGNKQRLMPHACFAKCSAGGAHVSGQRCRRDKKTRSGRPLNLAAVFSRPGCGCSLLSHGGEGTWVYWWLKVVWQRIPSTDLHYEHMHFVGNEGSNFGLTGSGEFSESVEGLKKYQVEAPKYRKQYIDKARLDVAQEREKNKWDTALNQNFIPPAYNAVVHNCQHYFAEVLQQAQKYETREKPLVLP